MQVIVADGAKHLERRTTRHNRLRVEVCSAQPIPRSQQQPAVCLDSPLNKTPSSLLRPAGFSATPPAAPGSLALSPLRPGRQADYLVPRSLASSLRRRERVSLAARILPGPASSVRRPTTPLVSRISRQPSQREACLAVDRCSAVRPSRLNSLPLAEACSATSASLSLLPPACSARRTRPRRNRPPAVFSATWDSLQ